MDRSSMVRKKVTGVIGRALPRLPGSVPQNMAKDRAEDLKKTLSRQTGDDLAAITKR